MSDPTSALQAKVLTVSDGVFHGVRDDTGGRGLGRPAVGATDSRSSSTA